MKRHWSSDLFAKADDQLPFVIVTTMACNNAVISSNSNVSGAQSFCKLTNYWRFAELLFKYYLLITININYIYIILYLYYKIKIDLVQFLQVPWDHFLMLTKFTLKFRDNEQRSQCKQKKKKITSGSKKSLKLIIRAHVQFSLLNVLRQIKTTIYIYI